MEIDMTPMIKIHKINKRATVEGGRVTCLEVLEYG
jgi:hypothetical protein